MDPKPTERILSNGAEAAFQQEANARGWDITKRGWPDFFCWRDGEIALVEVKPKRGRRLKRSQRRVLEALAAYGVPCFQWTPLNGLQPVTIETETVKHRRGIRYGVH